jgi:hypothetical protein
VLSALARGDVDPWVEAERLARLPAAAAAERLNAIMEAGILDAGTPNAGTPNAGTWDAEGLDTGETRDPTPPAARMALATRLIGLLPRRGGGNLVSRPAAAAAAIASSRTDIHAIALSAALLAFLLGAGWIMAGRQPAEKAGVASAVAAPIARPAPSPDPQPTTTSPR